MLNAANNTKTLNTFVRSDSNVTRRHSKLLNIGMPNAKLLKISIQNSTSIKG